MSTGTIVNDRAAWLEERRHGIGASEAAAVLGLSPYESPRELYLRKIGLLEGPEENEAMRQGSFMEPYIARCYEEETHTKVVQQQLFFKSHFSPLMATIDGMTAGGYPVEFKYVTRWNTEDLGEEDSDEIPDHWLIQGHQQMLLSGTYRVDFAVLPAGRRLKVYTVRRQEGLIEHIIKEVRAFWKGVEERVAPPFQPARDARTLHLIYPGCEGEIEFGEDLAEIVDSYEELGQVIRDEEELRQIAKARIKEAMGNHALGLLPDGRVITKKVIKASEVAYTKKEYFRISVRKGRV